MLGRCILVLSASLARAACGGAGRLSDGNLTAARADAITQAAIDAAPEAHRRMAKRRVAQPSPARPFVFMRNNEPLRDHGSIDASGLRALAATLDH
ncbi:hypothetical protein M885DRAFT_578024 [Pelagophyceae sp. CCMP2097]|nr:hypothetical protein M885DRAFT_578024 [Pelagophyceae sp. CCMP2097]